MTHNPLDDMPKRHPRSDLYNKKRLELRTFLLEWRQSLTVSEEMMLLASELAGCAQCCVLAERQR